MTCSRSRGTGWRSSATSAGRGRRRRRSPALARATVRATAGLGPAGAVARVHEAIRASGEHTYVTLCCAELRPTPDGIEASVPPPATPSRGWCGTTGRSAGSSDRSRWSARSTPRSSGRRTCASTRVPSLHLLGRPARGPAKRRVLRRPPALLTALAAQPPGTMLQRLEQEIVRFTGGNPRDDLAMFALRSGLRP